MSIPFYGIDYSYYDHPGKYSLIIYCSNCNFKCFGCHNRNLAGWNYDKNKNIVNVNTHDIFSRLSEDELEIAIKSNFIDMVILCGGEIMINSFEKIRNMILKIKELNKNVLIRVDTNGTYPEKVKKIIDEGIVDGLAIDIKGPYWNEKYHDKISNVIGIPLNKAKSFFDRITTSLEMSSKLEHTIYRTVKYPIINDPDYFTEIKKYTTEKLKKQHLFLQYNEL